MQLGPVIIERKALGCDEMVVLFRVQLMIGEKGGSN